MKYGSLDSQSNVKLKKNSFNIFHMLAESADPMIILSG